MKITFIADSDLADYSQAVDEYQQIWTESGKKIISVWEQITSLQFQEKQINAIIFNGVSHSHPLSLRYNIDFERKKSVLVHELGHRLIYGRVKQPDYSSLENHKTLFLVLYEVFVELFGTDFAHNAVEWDKNLPRDEFKRAWEWALQFSAEERREEFEKRIKIS